MRSSGRLRCPFCGANTLRARVIVPEDLVEAGGRPGWIRSEVLPPYSPIKDLFARLLRRGPDSGPSG